MQPTILNVFSICPKKENASIELKRRGQNSVITISHLNTIQPNEIETLNDLSGGEFFEEFSLCDSDIISNIEYGNTVNKELNLLEGFYKFQDRRNAILCDKTMAHNGRSSIQQTGMVPRPDYSYTQLIYMAIEGSEGRALTVNDIYSWCEQNFPYYSKAVNGWKNSLRHNLSINKCFKKVPKVGGRSSLWTIDPRERHHLVSTMRRSKIISLNLRNSIVVEEESIQNVPADLEDWRHLADERSQCQWSDSYMDAISDKGYSDRYSLDDPCFVETIYLDHNYCIPDSHSHVTNLPQTVTGVDSFSDNHDECWPQTPLSPTINYVDMSPSRCISPAPKKRGRPRKEHIQITLPVTPNNHKQNLTDETVHIKMSTSNRIDNMYHLNTFFNSL